MEKNLWIFEVNKLQNAMLTFKILAGGKFFLSFQESPILFELCFQTITQKKMPKNLGIHRN